MACCQKQAPVRDDRQLPNSGDRDQIQLVMASASAVVLPFIEAGHGSAFAAFFSELESRLAAATLQTQHICMQV
jgi:hypothetical protein